jgi:hypothetical protein
MPTGPWKEEEELHHRVPSFDDNMNITNNTLIIIIIISG